MPKLAFAAVMGIDEKLQASFLTRMGQVGRTKALSIRDSGAQLLLDAETAAAAAGEGAGQADDDGVAEVDRAAGRLQRLIALLQLANEWRSALTLQERAQNPALARIFDVQGLRDRALALVQAPSVNTLGALGRRKADWPISRATSNLLKVLVSRGAAWHPAVPLVGCGGRIGPHMPRTAASTPRPTPPQRAFS